MLDTKHYTHVSYANTNQFLWPNKSTTNYRQKNKETTNKLFPIGAGENSNGVCCAVCFCHSLCILAIKLCPVIHLLRFVSKILCCCCSVLPLRCWHSICGDIKQALIPWLKIYFACTKQHLIPSKRWWRLRRQHTAAPTPHSIDNIDDNTSDSTQHSHLNTSRRHSLILLLLMMAVWVSNFSTNTAFNSR